jgi:hypothetical protein
LVIDLLLIGLGITLEPFPLTAFILIQPNTAPSTRLLAGGQEHLPTGRMTGDDQRRVG